MGASDPPDLHFAILNPQFAIVSPLFSADSADSAPHASGVVISLCFWLSLLIAGALFAGATLSGKILEVERHAAQLAGQTARVEQLAHHIRRLELETRALETDPEYIAAVARRQLATNPPVANIAPHVIPQSDGGNFTSLDPRLEPFRPWMLRLASDSLLRARLLTLAAALVLFAFTFLQERSARLPRLVGDPSAPDS